MSRFDRYFGNTMATLIVVVVLWSIGYTLFSLLFRDGRGTSLYGDRGDVYMYEDY